MAGRWKKFDDIPKALRPRLEQAIIRGMNDTLAEAVQLAKSDHPSWQNRTGAAEGSIQLRGAEKVSETKYRGYFGSYGIDYFIWLEIGTRYHPADFTLRRAADRTFSHVWEKIEAAL